PVATTAADDRALDRLAVLVAAVVVEGMGQRAEPEDAVAGLDVEQPAPGPHAGPRAQQPVAGPLVRGVGRQVTPDEQRVERLDLDEIVELVEDRQLVLAVGVDREDEVVGRDLRRGETPSQVGEGLVVRGRHPPVLVERQQAGRRVPRQPRLDDRPRAVQRAVVHHDELVDQRVEPVEDGLDRRLFVVRGHDCDPHAATATVSPVTRAEPASHATPTATSTRPVTSPIAAPSPVARCSWKRATPMATLASGSTTMSTGSEAVSGAAANALCTTTTATAPAATNAYGCHVTTTCST